MKTAVALLLAVLLMGCSGEKPAAPAPPTQTAAPADPLVAPPYERNNLLNMARGAAVVDRTAELTFDNAAIHVIDGEKQTSWVSPPYDTDQTLIFSLGSNARVTRIGAHALHPGNPMDALLVEASVDGKRFTPLATINIARSAEPQWATVSPVEVRYLRISPRVSKGQRFAQLNAMMAEGEAVGSISTPAIAGCWSVNEMNADFVQKGTHLTGAIANLHLVGGVDGNVLRFIWTRGPEYGYAAMTVTPDSTRWSGIRWHEDVTIPGFGVTWFAERAACSASPVNDLEVVRDFFGKARRYPAYGLRFAADDTLDTAASESALAVLAEMIKARTQSRLIAHEFREQDANKAKQITEKRLQSLRAALKTRGVAEVPTVALGRENPRVPLHTAIAETMYSVVELEALP